MTARNTSASPTLYFFDIVEDYPEIGGVARVSARLRWAFRQHFGARVVAVRDIADGLGCGDKGEDYLARERRAMLRLAQVDPASTFFIPNFQNPLDRVADLIRPKVVNVVHDLQFASLPDLFTAEQHRWLDAGFSATRANADAIAFVSRTTRDHFVARYGAPARCRVIAAPIGATTPGRAVAGRPPFLLAVQHGECHPHKNVAGLLRLVAGLAERSPALTLLVTGRGRASFETECESLPRHVRDRVHHLGHVARDELNGLYRGAEAFVSLSRFEGFNMPAAEAASCGTPLILSDLPVHREFHTDGACFLEPTRPDVDAAAAFLADAAPRLRGYAWGRADLCSAASVVQAHIGLLAAIETDPAEATRPLGGARRVSATTRVFRVGTGRRRSVATTRRPIAAAVSRQRLARALLAGTILGGSAALLLGGASPARALVVAVPSPCADGTNAAGGNGGNATSGSTTLGGAGGCTPSNPNFGTSLDGAPGDSNGNLAGGGGGGAGGNIDSHTGGAGGAGGAGGFGGPGGTGGDGGNYGGTISAPGGGGFTGGTGGAGGDVTSTAVGLGGGGGGGGGVGTGVTSGPVTISGRNSIGGDGGQGGAAIYGNGGNGGDGGIGTEVQNATNLTLSSGYYNGGNGGAGGASTYYNGGNGGNGGAGVVFRDAGGTLTNNGTIQGGNGGNGGNSTYFTGGLGGAGSAAVQFLNGGTLNNTGTISGGVGGSGGVDVNGSFSAGGNNGNGVEGSGLNITNSGTISGLDALHLNGGLNTLTMQGANATLSGNIYVGVDNTNTGSLNVIVSTTAPPSNSPLTLTNTIYGAGSIEKSGDGLLILSGPNTYTGGTTLTAGTLQVTNSTGGTAPGDASSIGTGTLIFNGGTLQAPLLGNGGTFGLVFANAAVINANGGAIDANGNQITLSGNIADAVPAAPGSLAIVGSASAPNGTVILSGTNTYSGATLVGSGSQPVTLRAGSATAFSPNSAFQVDLGAVLALNGYSNTIYSLADGADGGGTVENNRNTEGLPPPPTRILTIAPQLGSTTFSGLITNGGTDPLAIVKDGAGTQIFAGANAYSGGTTINAGTLSLAHQTGGIIDASGSGPMAVNAGTLELAATGKLANAVTLGNGVTATIGATSGTTATIGGTFTFGTTGTAVFGSAVDTGTIVFAPTSVTGAPQVLEVAGGTLQAGAANANLGNVTQAASTTTRLDPGGTLDFNGNSATISNLQGTGGTLTNAASATTTINGGAFAGVIAGGGNVASTGSLTLSGVNTYTGATTITGGTLALAGPGSIAQSSGVAAAGTFDISQTNAGASITTLSGGGAVALGSKMLTVSQGSTTFSGVIADGGIGGGAGGAFGVSGGIQTLSGANTYTGATTITGGTLALAGPGSIAQSSGVAAAGTFDISQTNAGASITTLSGGGFVVLGARPLALTAAHDTFSGVISGTGSLTLSGGAETLSGVNAYSGGTHLNAGTLAVGNNAALGTGTLTFGGGTLQAAVDGLTLGNAAVLAANGTIDTQSFGLTYSGAITGAGQLTKAGTGMLVLTGTDTYAGGTTIAAGTLQIGNGGTTGSITGNIVDNGALAFNRSDAVTFAGVVSGSGSLTQAGTGTLTLTGADAYTGGTRIAAGTLQLGNGGTTGSIAGNVVDNGTLIFNRSDTVTFGGAISGSGSVAQIGSGTTILTAANTYAGGTRLDAGTLGVAVDNGLGTGSLTINGGTLQAEPIGTALPNVSLANNVTVNGAGTIDSNGGALTLGGNITGPGSLTYTATGGVFTGKAYDSTSIILTGTNTYVGGSTVRSGASIEVVADNALGTGSLQVDKGGLIDLFGHSQSVTSLNGAGVIFAGGSPTAPAGSTTLVTLAVQSGNFSGTIDHASHFISNGSGGTTTVNYGDITLVKSSGGTLTLSGSNNYGGGTQLLAGTIAVGNANALGTGTLAMSDGTTLQSAMDGPTLNIAITLAGKDQFDTQSYAKGLNLNGVISGAGTLVKIGSTGLSLNVANSYSGGTLLNAGTLAVGNNAALGTGTLTFGGGTLQAAVDGLTLGNAAVLAANGTIDTQSFGLTYSGAITGAGQLTKAGIGTLVLTGADAYAGDTTIAAGTLQIGNGGTTGSIIGNVVDNGALAFNRSDATTFEGAISGTGSLTQAGAGTLVLTGANSYAGATTVAAGTLQVGYKGHGSLGYTAVTVRSGATLGGSGTIAGSVTIADGGILAPGNSPGTLTVGSLTLTAGTNGSPGSILNYELGTIAAPGGQASDLTHVTGNLVLAGTLNVADSGGFTPGVYRIFDYGGTLTDQTLAVGTLPATYSGAIQTNVASEVNLVVASATASVQFWDGPLTTGNGTINGGSGTWNNRLTDWTDPTGYVNSAWRGGVAVFAGAAGTVAVADTIAFQGLQFTTDGYQITAVGGGTLTPTGIGNIRVDQGLTATIGAPLTGSGGISKDGLGTVVLTAANTYAGGTTIAAGTLQIGNGGTTGSITGDVVDNGALAFNRSDAITFAGVISGSGSLTQVGPGTLTLTGQNTYTGATTIAAGTLALSGQGSIADSSQLIDNGVFDISASASGVSLVSLGGTGGLVLGSNSLTLTNASGTFSGNIGGAGQFILQGGTEVLSGPNSYSGGTTIAGGALQIGDSASLGSGTVVLSGGTLQAGAAGLTVANAAQVTGTGTIDTQSFALAYTGVISGPGQLDKTGTGKLTLSGPNSYSGGTLLQQGTLALGNAGALGTGPLAMDENTTLLFAKGLTLGNDIRFTGATDPTINTAGHDSTISGTISGPGALTKKGAGTLTLTADNTYTGPTTVAAGTLSVDGGIAASTATIDNGATLAGSGTVGGLVARAGATVSPGTAANPYGTLHVSGAASFASGATFAVSINPAGQSSTLAVGGTATLGGAGVTVASASGTYDPATRFAILTAAGGVKGLFGSVSTATALAFLNPYLSYGSNRVTLAFRSNGATIDSVALTPNQQSVAAAIQGLDPNSPVVRSLQGLSPDQARRALDALAGSTHASAVTATVQDAGRVRTLLFDRLWNIGGGELDARTLLQQMNAPNTSPTFVNCFAPLPARPATPPTVYTAWGEGFGDFGHDSGDRNGAGLDHSLGGFVLGIDAPIHGLGAPYRVGIAGGYAQDRFTATGSGAGGSAGTSETIFGALYGGTRYGAVDVRLGVSAAHDSTDLNRNVSYPGFNEAEHSNYGGHTEQAFGEVGYRIAGPRYVFEPIFGAAYIHVHQDSFREQGGAAALLGFAQDDNLGTTTLGARGEIAPITGMPLVVRTFLGWRHTFGDINPISRLAFVAAPIPFTSQGAPIDTDVLAAEAGLDYRYSAAVSFGVSYVGQVGPRDYDHGVKGRIEYKF